MCIHTQHTQAAYVHIMRTHTTYSCTQQTQRMHKIHTQHTTDARFKKPGLRFKISGWCLKMGKITFDMHELRYTRFNLSGIGKN